MANWTNDPIKSFDTLRKVVHQTEIHEAIDERTIAQIAGTGPGTPYVWEYAGSSKLWVPAGIYPIAEPANWPPNQSPDNEFRDDHINDCRKRIKYLLNNTISTLYRHIINPRDRYFRPYDKTDFSTVDGVSFHPYQNGIGKVYFEDDPLLTGPTPPYHSPRAVHIEDLRNMLEHFVVIVVNTDSGGEYVKYGDSSGWQATANDAWDAAKADCFADSWSVNGSPLNIAVGMWGKIVHRVGPPEGFLAYVEAYKTTYNFNLNIFPAPIPPQTPWNIVPPIWAKLVCAGYATTYTIGMSDFSVNCFAKCVETGIGATVPKITAGHETRGYAIDETGIATFVGNASVNLTFTAHNDFSLIEMDQIRPPVKNPSGTSERYAYIPNRKFVGSSHQAGTGVVIKPDWHRPD